MITVSERRAGASTQLRSRMNVISTASRASCVGSAPDYAGDNVSNYENTVYLEDSATSLLPEKRLNRSNGGAPFNEVIKYYADVGDAFYHSRRDLAESSTALLNSGCTEAEIWLSKVYAMERVGKSRAASKLIFTFVERKFSQEDIASVNMLLAYVEMNKLSIWSISGLLRVTAGANSFLPLWPSRLNEAKRLLFMRGEDIVSLFRGLQGGACK